MDQITVIKGTPQKNKPAQVLIIVGVVVLLLSLVVSSYVFNNVRVYYGSYYYGGYYEWCLIYDSFVDFFADQFFNLNCYYGYILILGVVIVAVGVIMKVSTEKCEITVMNGTIEGKLPHGKDVSIPLNQVTALNRGAFNGISIVSVGRVSNFYCFENRDDVIKAISYLLTDPQQAARQVSGSRSVEVAAGGVEQLKGLKELLDSGVLTQEEFENKKKQILGL